ncbi:MAG: hypothetical protein JWM57_982 [Phycisphaerales bacterium]|nr:hypothetical protein [Phycisphaerales bacterium]
MFRSNHAPSGGPRANLFAGRGDARTVGIEALERRTLLAGLSIVPTFAANINSDPNAATIKATINAAINVFQAWIATPITVAITFQESTTGLGASTTLGAPFSYTSVRAALAARATTPDALAAVASLPSQTNDPVTNSPNVRLTTANAHALGLAVTGTPDSVITLNTGICNLSRASTDPTKYDLMAVAAHEIDEALGFGSALNGLINGTATPTGPVYLDDLFRFDQNGNRSFNTASATQAYFSINGGITDLAKFNQYAPSLAVNGDYSDWSSPSVPLQVQDAYLTPGVTADLGVELRRLNVLGYTLNFAAAYAGVLHINDYFGQASSITVSQSGSSLQVTDNGAVETFTIASVSSIVLHGNDGNDTINLESNGGLSTDLYGDADNDTINFSSALKNLNNITGHTFVYGGGGFDTLTNNDGNNTSVTTDTISAFQVLRSGFGGLNYSTDLEALTFTSGTAADTVNVTSTSANTTVAINSSGGADGVNVGAGGSVQAINGDLTVNNSPSFSTLNINDSADAVARTFVTMYNGSLLGLAPAAINWATGDVNALNLLGGTGGNLFFVHSGPTSYFANLSMGSGNDSVVFESNAPGLFTLNGQGGADSVNVFDPAASAQTYTFNANGLSRTGLTINVSATESVGVNAGDAADAFNFSGSMQYGINVDAGGGSDTFTAGSGAQAQFFGDSVLTGGAGNDTYAWNNGSNNWYDTSFGLLKYTMALVGGAGFNSFSVDDTSRGNTGYQLYANRLYAVEPTAFQTGYDFTYSAMGAIGLTASGGNNALAVLGTSSDIAAGNQITVNLNGGNDTATMYPHDNLGNLTINGVIGIVGGAGTDSMTFDDTGSSGGIDYQFSNPFGAGTQDVFGMGAAGMGYTSDFESATIKGGNGDDTFDINQYKAGTGLGIYGGGGNDTLNFGANNLPVNITNIAAFGFDGQGGSDTFNVNNASEINQWTYTAQATTIQSERVAGSTYYIVVLSQANIESLNVNAGTGTDVMNLFGVPAGQTLTFHGGNGADALNLPDNLTGVLGPVNFFGDAGSNNINELTNSSTVAATAHLDQNSFGAYAGDNFFPAGSALFFQGVANMTLTFGSGQDTVYAQPNATAVLSIRGGSPTAAPGDTINLALAGVSSPVVTPVAGGSGSVTSSNRATLGWSGFETGPTVDAVAPTIDVAHSNFLYDAARQALSVLFSENIVAPKAGSFVLSRLHGGVTETIPATNIAATYNAATHVATFTFPGFTNGVLPDGNYTATFDAAGIKDTAGNGLAATTAITLFALSGDANRDRVVNFNDFLVLQNNFGQTGRVFSQGDFNYDGTTDFNDFLILQNNFGQSVSAVPIAATPTGGATVPVVTPPPASTKTAGLSGFTFNDNNRNGNYGKGDTLAAGKILWLDLDDDGVKDTNEPSTVSDAQGRFAFKNLAAGQYHVRRVFPAGYLESTPARYVALAAGRTVANVYVGSTFK